MDFQDSHVPNHGILVPHHENIVPRDGIPLFLRPRPWNHRRENDSNAELDGFNAVNDYTDVVNDEVDT